MNSNAPVARGTPAYRRLTLAMLFAGFSTFSLLYGVQPLLPLFASQFRLNAETASLAVSVATGPMAIVIPLAGLVSDRLGRRPILVAAMFLAGALTTATAFVPGWALLLAMRLLAGVALAGVPAVAMAYVSEEVDAPSVGAAMGLYIAGSAIGGMAGRLGVSLVADWMGWRWSLAAVGIASLAMAEGFRRLAPHSHIFVGQRSSLAIILRGSAALFGDAAMPWLYAQAFLLMGVFVTLYNYLGFRLLAPPYNLTQGEVGAVFLLYILGSLSSASAGRLADRYGRRRIFWMPVLALLAGILVTAAAPLWLIIAGIGIATAGFFGAHSIASSWVGRRAQGSRGQAAALYLFFYYLGSSVLGTAGGIAWTRAGWHGIVLFCTVFTVLALAAALRLIIVAPLAANRPTPPSVAEA